MGRGNSPIHREIGNAFILQNQQGGYMKMNSKALLAAAGIAMFAASPASAYEFGYPGWATKPGVLIGASAGVPPPGIYMANQVFTNQNNLSGPGTNGKTNIGLHSEVDVQGFL